MIQKPTELAVSGNKIKGKVMRRRWFTLALPPALPKYDEEILNANCTDWIVGFREGVKAEARITRCFRY
jgi:hypothetical protein